MPCDVFEPLSEIAYLRIREPKTKTRGARVQHASIIGAREVEFLELALKNIPLDEEIVGLSGTSFRRRWDRALWSLHIDRASNYVPGGIRGGGAVDAFKKGVDIPTLCWRMRVTSQNTLAHYLQEVLASTSLSSLSPPAKLAVRSLSESYDDMIAITVLRLRAGLWVPLNKV